MVHDILYSFRRCPYAMRARLAIKASGLNLEVREIALRHKPQEMLDASPKGTVPVLVKRDGGVIDESFDIMLWALKQNDPDDWLVPYIQDKATFLAFIKHNDQVFKYHLDRFKYPNRYCDNDEEIRALRETSRAALLIEFDNLNQRLENQNYIMGDRFTLADAAILPFIRQAANVDHDWFDQLPFKALHQWLDEFLESDLFVSIMPKLDPWSKNDDILLFNKITRIN